MNPLNASFFPVFSLNMMNALIMSVSSSLKILQLLVYGGHFQLTQSVFRTCLDAYSVCNLLQCLVSLYSPVLHDPPYLNPPFHLCLWWSTSTIPSYLSTVLQALGHIFNSHMYHLQVGVEILPCFFFFFCNITNGVCF